MEQHTLPRVPVVELLSPSRIPVWQRNLAQRLARPAFGNGRLQRLARRALIVLGEATTSQVMEWTCCRKRLHGRRIECHDYRAARRALDRVAVRVGRARSIGRPILWRLRNSAEE
jgi:hypothetical protein